MKRQAKIYILEKSGEFSAILSGTLEEQPNGFFVEYDDGDGVTCVIGYSKGIATVTRTQDPVYTIILEEDCPHAFNIETPYGNIEAVAHPVTVRSRKSGNGRTLKLVYDLALGKEKVRHELRLKIEAEE